LEIAELLSPEAREDKGEVSSQKVNGFVFSDTEINHTNSPQPQRNSPKKPSASLA